MEALMILNCSGYSENILDILMVFRKIGWDIYNVQGEVEYLPIGDNGNYDWRCEVISEIELYDIVLKKINKKEQVGVNLFYNNSVTGISMMAYNTEQIMLSISIERRIINGKYTDMVWYIENIIYKFLDNDVRLLSYGIEEYEG